MSLRSKVAATDPSPCKTAGGSGEGDPVLRTLKPPPGTVSRTESLRSSFFHLSPVFVPDGQARLAPHCACRPTSIRKGVSQRNQRSQMAPLFLLRNPELASPSGVHPQIAVLNSALPNPCNWLRFLHLKALYVHSNTYNGAFTKRSTWNIMRVSPRKDPAPIPLLESI